METDKLIMNMENNKKIFSVSEFIKLLNIGLKRSQAKIIGEVSEAKIGPTGHVYFSLKDEVDGSVMNCIIWKYNYGLYGIKLEVGIKIIASGNPEIYAPSGRLSFIAQTIELAGEGALKKEYEQLKKKLTEEGIFAEEKKRPIPVYAQKIGLITSKQGAVLSDFLNNIGKYNFQIKMIDSRVEGQDAVTDLLASIKTFKKQDIDVLIIMRGGGSLESMMAFNNELLVREVANFPVPVIAAIGHDKDVPLVALAADLAVSTPTAAAPVINKSWNEAKWLLERYQRDIINKYEEILNNASSLISRILDSARNALLNIGRELKNLLNKSLSGFEELLLRVDQKLKYAEKLINLNNPERQLLLGYSIAMINGKIVRKTKDFKIGDNINLRVSDGVIISQVDKINNNKKNG
ncbi:MAG: exodeoxyribonuclease VII large subunit [Patescibacteria group bacterium]|nr:exodeoxyribonuclease VII large subunit [Patescibacteria group bacterium]MBU1877068.1 exodeoxyribonuclease VII large subunit [Patescibacteria group bacterium]